MMSFNYIGHMAVEAEDQLMEHQNIRPKHILFTAFTRVEGICGSL
jgi:hypothetical protein